MDCFAEIFSKKRGIRSTYTSEGNGNWSKNRVVRESGGKVRGGLGGGGERVTTYREVRKLECCTLYCFIR